MGILAYGRCKLNALGMRTVRIIDALNTAFRRVVGDALGCYSMASGWFRECGGSGRRAERKSENRVPCRY